MTGSPKFRVSLHFFCIEQVESPSSSGSQKKLDVDSIWNHQLRHLLESGQEEATSHIVGRPLVNVSADDHIGAVKFQAIAIPGSHSTSFTRGSFDSDLLKAISAHNSPKLGPALAGSYAGENKMRPT